MPTAHEKKVSDPIAKTLSLILKPNQSYWMACEFGNQILIYKSTKDPAIDLISIGRTWTDIYHIIDLKYRFFVGLNIQDDQTTIRSLGHTT